MQSHTAGSNGVLALLSFQELDLSKEAFIFNDTPKEPEWMKAVFDGLHPGGKYAFVRTKDTITITLHTNTVMITIWRGEGHFSS